VLVDDRKGAGLGEPIDTADASVVRVAKVREAADALAKGKFEGWNLGQVLAQAQHLERFACAFLDKEIAFTEPVLE
jgi:hypothetical protein